MRTRRVPRRAFLPPLKGLPLAAPNRLVTRVLLHACCVFLLLFAQQSALTHIAKHAPEQSPEQHDGKGKWYTFNTPCAVCTARVRRCLGGCRRPHCFTQS